MGHVDEIISFVPATSAKGFKLLIASPKHAYEILDANKVKHPSAKMLVARMFPAEKPGVNQEVSIADFLSTGRINGSKSQLNKNNLLADFRFVFMLNASQKKLDVST